MKKGIDRFRNSIINENVVEGIEKLPDKSINMVVTSPPYWNLRNYGNKTYCKWDDGWEGQLGNEPNPDLYIKHLCDIFDLINYKIRDDGTIWVNISDTYSSNSKSGAKSKSLIGIPFKFANEMINRDYILRNTIIWHKTNATPCSVKDRFTLDFEYLFFFSKNKKYYFEQQFEPYKSSPHGGQFGQKSKDKNVQYAKDTKSSRFYGNLGRNKRTTWTIPTKPSSLSHCAMYPDTLIETPIKAGCPTFVCTKCGNPKVADIKKIKLEDREDNRKKKPREDYGKVMKECPNKGWKSKKIHNGYKPTCDCNTEFKHGIVLDPFMGAGTTALTAKKLNRDYIGFEINREYVKIARNRLIEYIKNNR